MKTLTSFQTAAVKALTEILKAAVKMFSKVKWKRFQKICENVFMKRNGESCKRLPIMKTAGGNDKWKRLHFYENWMDLPFKPINENVYILTTSPENDIIYM